MFSRIGPVALLTGLLAACSSVNHQPTAPRDSLQEFQKHAARFHSIVTVPPFETTTNQVQASVRDAIASGNAALDRIGKLGAREVTFTNTVRALDNIDFQLGLVDNRLSLIKETSPDAALRDAATDSLKELQEWMVGLDYREDVYRAIKAYADTQPKLEGEDAKLLLETMRDYRRAGLELAKADRDDVERMRK